DFPPERHQKEPTHGGKHAERAHDQWKDHPRGIIRVEINSDAKNHRANVFGGSRLEKIGATAGTVADVVAHKIGDDGGVTRIILGNAGLDLADEVGAHIGGLRIDPATQLCEKGDEARTEPKAHNA